MGGGGGGGTGGHTLCRFKYLIGEEITKTVPYHLIVCVNIWSGLPGFDTGFLTRGGGEHECHRSVSLIDVHTFCAIYFHCACYRLQLASIHAVERNPEIKKVFGMMTNIWKLFYYSPKKAETLNRLIAEDANTRQLRKIDNRGGRENASKMRFRVYFALQLCGVKGATNHNCRRFYIVVSVF